MVRELDHLDQQSLLERAGDDETAVDERRPVVIVHLVTMTVSLVHDGFAIGSVRTRSHGQLDRLSAEPHRPAEVLDLFLLRQQVDDGMRSLRIHFRRVRTVESEHVASKLRDGDVHPETDAEVRNRSLARDSAREDLALPAA